MLLRAARIDYIYFRFAQALRSCWSEEPRAKKSWSKRLVTPDNQESCIGEAEPRRSSGNGASIQENTVRFASRT